MTGSLQIKSNQYYVVARIPDDTGKERQKWISTGLATSKNNKRNAQQAMRRILTELENQKVVYSTKTMFTDWIWKWLELKKEEVRQNTYEGYTLYMKLHIEPYFKPMGLALDTITPQHLQDYYTFKRKAVNGKAGLASNSLRKHHVILHSALQEAMRKNLIAYNPADRVSVPKKEEFIGKAYNAEQANELIALLSAEPLKSAVILGLFYGLRRSEVCGMRWRDIDFKAGTMRVCNTVVKTSTVIEHEMTKSKASKRTMILIPETVPYLQHLKRKQLESRLLMGRCYQEGDHVCVWENGKPVGPDYVSHAFHDFLAQNNLPHIRFHELRHTTGSLLLEKGLSAKQIQEYLGHEKVSTTLDIYGHLSIEGKKEAAHVMDGVLDLLAI